MNVTLTLQEIISVLGGIATVILVVWRVRPYVQSEVEKAVAPIRAELSSWHAESMKRHNETQATAQEILKILRPLEHKVEALERGNEAGKQGIIRLSDAAVERERRVHNLEVHAEFVSLKGAAQKASGAA